MFNATFVILDENSILPAVVLPAIFFRHPRNCIYTLSMTGDDRVGFRVTLQSSGCRDSAQG